MSNRSAAGGRPSMGARGGIGGGGGYGAITVGAPIGGTVDDAPQINAKLATGAAFGGSSVYLQRGDYLVRSLIDYPGNRLRLRGQGPGVTRLVFDDATALVKWIRCHNRYACSLEDVTLTSNAAVALAAGVALSVEGGDAAILVNAVPTCMFNVHNVEMLKQCSGMQIIDGAGAVPSWMVNVACNMLRWECANNGIPLRIDSTGGIHYIDGIFATMVTGAATAPLYQAQLTATKDCVLTRYSATFGTDGLRIDPGVGQEITAINIRDCRFDSVTNFGAYINPNTGAAFCRQIDIVDTWLATNVVGAVISGSPTRAVSIRGCQIYRSNSGVASILWDQNAPFGGLTSTEISVDECEIGGNGYGIVTQQAGLHDFSIRNNKVVVEYGLTPTEGLRLQAGSIDFIATGNNLRLATVPLNDLSGAVNKVVANNIIV